MEGCIIVHIIVVTLLLQAVADDGWRQAGARPHRPSRRHGQTGERKNETARQINNRDLVIRHSRIHEVK
jgi:hypothetical protein